MLQQQHGVDSWLRKHIGCGKVIWNDDYFCEDDGLRAVGLGGKAGAPTRTWIDSWAVTS